MLWLEKNQGATAEFAKSYMHLTKEEGYNWGFIRTLLACPADTAIIQMQDLLALSAGARMNTPSIEEGNSAWRVRGECINDWLTEIIYKKTALYRRIPTVKKEKNKTEQKK